MNPQSANFLSSDVEIKGTLSFGQALTFEGKIEGEIKTQGRVVIGQKAIVQGDVYAGAVVIAGRPPASAPAPQQSAPAQGGAPNNPQNPPPQSPAPRRLFG